MIGWSDLWYCCMTRSQSIRHAAAVHPERSSNRWTFLNTSSTNTAHKEGCYQAGHCWGQMMVAAPEFPSPSDWGWKQRDTGGWDFHWTTLPQATQACRELLKCGCKKGCSMEGANVPTHHFSALHFVIVVDCVLIVSKRLDCIVQMFNIN